MRQSHRILLGLLPWLASANPIAEHQVQVEKTDSVSNANHIFNSIHDSMRQFGSSLNHNGMGVFIATVPEGTEFYHGTSNPYRVNGTEWLAFEPEHAMIFARSRRGGPPGHGPPPGKGQPGDDEPPHGPPPQQMYDSEEEAHQPEQEDSHPPKPGNHREEGRTPPPPPRGEHRPSPGSKNGKHHFDEDHESRPSKPDHHSKDGRPSKDKKHSGEEDRPRQHESENEKPGRPQKKCHPKDDHEDHPVDKIYVSKYAQSPDRHDDTPLPSPDWRGYEHLGGKELHGPPRKEEGPRGIAGAIGRLFGQHQLAIDEETKDHPIPDPQHDAADNDEDQGEDQNHGYLHTYRTKHALRLIYLDGQSAAKSTKGTLDVQDILLRNTTDSGEGRGMFGEKERADELCHIARTEYAGRVDGILRMEGGFEIILCDFDQHLDVVRIMAAKSSGMGGGPGGDGEDHFNYYEAVAARYDDIGAGRVVLDYDNFVSVFAYPGVVYFDSTNRPRVRNDSAELEHVRVAIKEMVLADDGTAATATNWQDVVDQIVTRYADRIEYMASGQLKTAQSLKAEIERAIRPFIDYTARNATLEAQRCATQFWPVSAASSNNSVAALAVRETYQTLCSSLAFAAQESTYENALAMVRELKQYLAWTTWKKCRGCEMHEICLLPIWPMGSEEDFVQPRCASAETLGDRRGNYWGGFGGPPRGAKDGKGEKGRKDRKKDDKDKKKELKKKERKN